MRGNFFPAGPGGDRGPGRCRLLGTINRKALAGTARLAAPRRVLSAATALPGRRWGTAGGVVAGVLAGLLVVGACTAAVQLTRRAAPASPALITIRTGNLTFTSAQPAGPGRRAGGDTTGQHTLTSGAVSGDGGGAASGRGGGAAPGTSRGQGSGTLIDRHPERGITVRVADGRLASVSVTSGRGSPVAGSLTSGGTAWQTQWALAPGQRYHVTVVAMTRRGARTVSSGSFRTLAPRHTFSATSTLTSGQTYGVGMPIMIDFSHPVAASDRAGVERALQVYSSKPVTGAWYWLSGSEAWFRPRHYWPAHTQVRLAAHLRGVAAAPGVYGDRDLHLHFRIGNSLVVLASAASHYMKVWWKGHLLGDWPISTGEPGLDTPDGRYLSFAMGNPVDMNSATFGVMPGDPGYYNVMVYDSVQFTGSGDYIHSAPWSVGEQGYVNVSHGCVNVAPDKAAWYYDHSLIGDPITVVGSPVPGTWGDGWTIWFLSWRKLVGGSATGQAVLADASGSRFVTPSLKPAAQPQARLRSGLTG